MTQATPTPRGERVGSPVEVVVVTLREFFEWLDRSSPEVKAAEDHLLERVPDDRLIAELRRRGYQMPIAERRAPQPAAMNAAVSEPPR